MKAKSDQEKEKHPHHVFNSIRFQSIPVSPSETNTPLQVVCFFDQTKNQVYAGGTEAVNEHFGGAIKKLRAEDLFRGELLETLVITPRNEQIPAKKLLMIGLGDPAAFELETMRSVGRVAMNEAIKLEVANFCFAPSLKDAGVASLPAADVSFVIAEGMMQALNAARILAARELIPEVKVNEVIFLAGAAHLTESQAGLKKAMEAAKARI